MDLLHIITIVMNYFGYGMNTTLGGTQLGAGSALRNGSLLMGLEGSDGVLGMESKLASFKQSKRLIHCTISQPW